MIELQKLEVLLLEKYQEPVHLFLCRMGVVQYIKVDWEKEYSGLLNACPIPNEISLENSDIQKRIEKILKELDLNLENGFDEVSPLPGNTFKEILIHINESLTKIETRTSEMELSKVKRNQADFNNQLEETAENVLERLGKEYSEKLHSSPEKKHKADGDLIKEILNLGREADCGPAMMTAALEKPESFTTNILGLVLPEALAIYGPEIEDIYSNLLDLYGMTEEIEVLLEEEHNMGHIGTIVYLEAWVVETQISKIEEGIKEITHGKCIIEKEKPKPDENVPTIIEPHHMLFEGFESLTYSLGIPRKEEINPTLLMAFTFPFLFGIMFADVGQGIILFLMGIFLLSKRKKVDINKVGEIASYFLRSAGIITLCGISAIFFGFLYGEFFGPSGVLDPILLFEIGPFKFGGFDPVHEPLTMLRFTILIGVTFITLGLFLSLINHYRRRDWAKFIAYLCWIWFLLGGFTMWVGYGGISQITIWFGDGLPMFAILVLVPLLIMLIVTAKAENFMEGVDLTVEAFIESLGHTLSFCRLAALFLTHTALNTMFLNLGGVDVVNGFFPLSSIPLVAVGTLLALFIEGLLVMVHCLRLQWIEILPKFYSGKGILFKPINIK